jgi:hypothetical protein
MREVEFKGYWSDIEKKLWRETDWTARDYEELPVESDTFEADAYFYGVGSKETKKITFIKYIRPNPIFPPYYGPVYTTELLEFMKNGSYCYPSYDGRTEGQYDIHDRFDTSELADMLSR